jgi:hypothetical protein
MSMSMRNSILTLSLLLLTGTWAVAQYGGPYGGDRGEGGARMRVAGCLYGDNGYLTLFDDNGNTYQVVGRQAARLGRFVGHRVQVEGRTFFDADNPSAMAANGESVPTLRVFEIEHVDRDRCDAGWGGNEGGINIHIP